MCEAGRVLHHLANSVEDEKNIILIVGYTAEHTLGRKIVNGEKQIRIFGEEYNLNSEVVVMDSFSAHADADELLDYCRLLDRKMVKEIFLVHGEIESQMAFRDMLKNELGFHSVQIPQRGDEYNI